MESVLIAARNTFLKLAEACGKTLRRFLLKSLRNALDRADEWCHAQEVRLRDEAAMADKSAVAAAKAEVDPAASRQRERKIRAARPRLARLKYQHGEFVRSA